MPHFLRGSRTAKVQGHLNVKKATSESIVSLRAGFVSGGKPGLVREFLPARTYVGFQFFVLYIQGTTDNKQAVTQSWMFNRVAQSLQAGVGVTKDQPPIEIKMRTEIFDVG